MFSKTIDTRKIIQNGLIIVFIDRSDM